MSKRGQPCAQARSDFELLQLLRSWGCKTVPAVQIVERQGFELLRTANLTVGNARVIGLGRVGVQRALEVLGPYARTYPGLVSALFRRIKNDFEKAEAKGRLLPRNVFFIRITRTEREPRLQAFIVDVSEVMKTQDFKSNDLFQRKATRLRSEFDSLIERAEKLESGR